MFNWFVFSLWEPLGIWRQINVGMDSVSMCSVFHLHPPDFSACGDGWEAHSA